MLHCNERVLQVEVNEILLLQQNVRPATVHANLRAASATAGVDADYLLCKRITSRRSCSPADLQGGDCFLILLGQRCSEMKQSER